MQVVITGGAGFIGSSLVEALVADGHDVRVIDDLSTGYSQYIDPAAETVIGDVADERLARRAVKGADVVFHQAALRAVQRSVDNPLATDQANTHGTLTVLKAAADAGVRRVINASSSSVYGGAEQLPTPETAPTWPRSPYAVSKLAGEHYCRVFAELYGVETVSLRYFNVYGPRQRPDSQYAAVIPLFIAALRAGQDPIVHGDGRQSRDFTFIDDAVAANLSAAGAPASACSGKVYNVAGGAAYSLLDLLSILERIVEAKARPVHGAPRPGDVRHTRADIEAGRRDLGHQPRVSFEEGLRRTAEWFRDGSLARSGSHGIDEERTRTELVERDPAPWGF
jgi:UDP-glucose 4-epimerase